MKPYLDLLRQVNALGADKSDRTGVGTRSLFGTMMAFDLREGFPLVTTKRLHTRSIFLELLWIISGSTNVRDLQKDGVTIWDEWAGPDGDLGPVYGKQWRDWEAGEYLGHNEWKTHYIDQLGDVLKRLKSNPDCRRLVVSAWNPVDLPKMALAPCHCLFQFYTVPLDIVERIELAKESGDGKDRDWDGLAARCEDDELGRILDLEGVPTRWLDCRLDQRSADLFLGVPFNIASYALLTHLVARHVGMLPRRFIWQGGDTHIYANHFDQVRIQLEREPRPLPQLHFKDGAPIDLFEIRLEHIGLPDYEPHPAISAPVAV